MKTVLDMAIRKQQRSRLIRWCNPGASAISTTVSFLVFHRRVSSEVLHRQEKNKRAQALEARLGQSLFIGTILLRFADPLFVGQNFIFGDDSHSSIAVL